MMRWMLALVVLVAAMLVGLLYMPEHTVNQHKDVSKCPFAALSYAQSQVKSSFAWLAKRLQVPILWLKRLQLESILGQELSDDAVTIRLPECKMRPFKAQEVEKGRHVSMLGQVYDVSTYPEMYGPGAGYEYLTGFDATRYLALAAPPEDQAPEKVKRLLKGYALDGLETAHLNQLMQWMHLFQSKYNCVGYQPGIYYLPTGRPTDYLRQLVTVWESFRRQAIDLRKKLPSCKITAQDSTVLLSCEHIKEPFVPRNLLLQIEASPSCHCVPQTFPKMPNLLPIAGCDETARTCTRTEANDNLPWPQDLRLIPIKAPTEVPSKQ